MDHGEKKRLERLLDDLAELDDMGFKPFGFGIITSSTSVRLPQPNGWKFLVCWLEDENSTEAGGPRGRTTWLDAFPDGSSCVRWWGDRRGVAAFQKWASRASNIIRRFSGGLPDMNVYPGHYGTVAEFVRFARMEADLARLVECHMLADLNLSPKEDRALIHKSLLPHDPLPVFSLQEVKDRVVPFSAKILKKLLGRPSGEPRLAVDVADSTITLDGKTCWADIVYVAILDELLKANGRPITRAELQQNPILQSFERLDRQIAYIRKGTRGFPFRIPIQTAKKRRGYLLPSDYLA